MPRPIILFADGHFEQFSQDVQDLLRQHNIYFYVMRSEGRNLIQPLDLLFYQVFKKEWSDSKSLLQKPLPRGGVIKSRFPTVYKDAWEKTYNAKALVDSFKRSGLCPWNTSSPQYSKVVQPGKPDLASNCARLAPNGTNLGLLKISFLFILCQGFF